MRTHLQVHVRTLPRDEVRASDFELREAPLPRPAAGEALVRHAYLSLDPYMRKRLADAVAGRFDLGVGSVMMGRTVGTVVESRDPSLRPGDHVLGWGGWREYSVAPAIRLEKVTTPDGLPLSAHLGVLGRPGITAWLGIVHVARVQAGECVVVSSAAGAVGSLAGQMARHLGADVIGIAGGPAKCRAVVGELGLRACLDYKSEHFLPELSAATPRGVQVNFENVGGAVWDATLDRMAENGRVAVCGLISHYHSGPPYAFRHIERILDRGLQVTGFRIDALVEHHERARCELVAWASAGVFRRWESVSSGLGAAPAAFVAMLRGEGRGKTLVHLA